MSDAYEIIKAMRGTRAELLARFLSLPDEKLESEAPWRGKTFNLRFRLGWLAESDEGLLGRVREAREAGGLVPTAAQRVLPILGTARGALDGWLHCLPASDFATEPEPDEWSLFFVLAHVIATDQRYFESVRFACDRQASGGGGPLRPPPERLPPNDGSGERHGTRADVLGRLRGVREEIVRFIAAIPDALLGAPTTWLAWDVDVRFRLYRFAAHDREHTIQVQKVLRSLAVQPGEADLLLVNACSTRGALEGELAALPDGAIDSLKLNGRPLREALQAADAEESELLTAG